MWHLTNTWDHKRKNGLKCFHRASSLHQILRLTFRTLVVSKWPNKKPVYPNIALIYMFPLYQFFLWNLKTYEYNSYTTQHTWWKCESSKFISFFFRRTSLIQSPVYVLSIHKKCKKNIIFGNNTRDKENPKYRKKGKDHIRQTKCNALVSVLINY